MAEWWTQRTLPEWFSNSSSSVASMGVYARYPDWKNPLGREIPTFASVANSLRATFRPIQKKNSTAEEKIGPPSNFPFSKDFGLKKNTNLVCESGKITIFLGHFPRIREDKRRKTILLKLISFSALFVQNRPKFRRRIVRRFTFYSALLHYMPAQRFTGEFTMIK